MTRLKLSFSALRRKQNTLKLEKTLFGIMFHMNESEGTENIQ